MGAGTGWGKVWRCQVGQLQGTTKRPYAKGVDEYGARVSLYNFVCLIGHEKLTICVSLFQLYRTFRQTRLGHQPLRSRSTLCHRLLQRPCTDFESHRKVLCRRFAAERCRQLELLFRRETSSGWLGRGQVESQQAIWSLKRAMYVILLIQRGCIIEMQETGTSTLFYTLLLNDAWDTWCALL
jgi:hypothetical protein